MKNLSCEAQFHAARGFDDVTTWGDEVFGSGPGKINFFTKNFVLHSSFYPSLPEGERRSLRKTLFAKNWSKTLRGVQVLHRPLQILHNAAKNAFLKNWISPLPISLGVEHDSLCPEATGKKFPKSPKLRKEIKSFSSPGTKELQG